MHSKEIGLRSCRTGVGRAVGGASFVLGQGQMITKALPGGEKVKETCCNKNILIRTMLDVDM